jgi:galactokinase
VNESHRVRAFAPGRVNLIGEHTDYTGGLALPMAIDLGTTVEGSRRAHSDRVVLRSANEGALADVSIHVEDPASVTPAWARYVAGVVHEVRPPGGFDGTVRTTMPVGSGLSSSAALELSVALALGFAGSPSDLATMAQRAEQIASGVPCGVMDQLASASGVAGHALLMNFTTMHIEPVPVPEGVDILVVHSGQERTLAGSAYAERRQSCEMAATRLGPLLDADLEHLSRLGEDTMRRRARHVITENQRVLDFAEAFRANDLVTAGQIMGASHVSLRDDFEVSTKVLDDLVESLSWRPGVFGARLTGAGFGGCVVALAEQGAVNPARLGNPAWIVHASSGASVTAI